MEHLYTVYYNDGNEVYPLCMTEGYTTADENYIDTVNIFLSKFFTKETPYSVRKYKELNEFIVDVKADISFPEGIAFSKKLHDFCVYEKTKTPGTLYHGYSVKYIGRIGVICQQRKAEEHQNVHVASLKTQIEQKDNVISQQESLIKRLEAEVSRLSLGNPTQTTDMIIFSGPPPEAPVPPPPCTPRKLSEFAKKGQVSTSVLEELTKLFDDKNKEEQERKRREEDDKLLQDLIDDITTGFLDK